MTILELLKRGLDAGNAPKLSDEYTKDIAAEMLEAQLAAEKLLDDIYGSIP